MTGDEDLSSGSIVGYKKSGESAKFLLLLLFPIAFFFPLFDALDRFHALISRGIAELVQAIMEEGKKTTKTGSDISVPVRFHIFR